jgi:hypothetical protein
MNDSALWGTAEAVMRLIVDAPGPAVKEPAVKDLPLPESKQA